MNEVLLFAGSVALSLLAWGVVCLRCWPSLRRMPLADAARPILLLHSFRFLGLAFVIPGVVSPALQAEFAVPAAYGDLGAVVLAWLAWFALGSSSARVALWVFNLWGTVDLLSAFFQPTLFFGFEDHGDAGGRLATPEKALVDFLYLTPARSKLFRALPELEWPKRFRAGVARDMVRRIEPARRRALVAAKLEGLLSARCASDSASNATRS